MSDFFDLAYVDFSSVPRGGRNENLTVLINVRDVSFVGPPTTHQVNEFMTVGGYCAVSVKGTVFYVLPAEAIR